MDDTGLCLPVWHSPSWEYNSLPWLKTAMQGKEIYGKIAAVCVTTVETFGKIAATSARTVETFRVIGEISGRMFNQERARDRSHKIGETFARIGRISGKIIGTSGTTAKTGVEIGETYATTWLATESTDVKSS